MENITFTKNKNHKNIPNVDSPDDYYPVEYVFYKYFGIIWKDEEQDDEIGRIYTDEKSDTCIISIWDNVVLYLHEIGELMDLAEKQTGKPCEWQVWENNKFDGINRVKRVIKEVVKDETV